MSIQTYHQPLVDFEKKKDFFIGVDSDGCVFDSMELKHKECFCPAFIGTFGLQGVSTWAREVWEKVNLYSRSRGVNRFLALQKALRILANDPRVAERGVQVPPLDGLGLWIQESDSLDMVNLGQRIEKTADPDLCQVWEWSTQVNRAIKEIVRGLPPLPAARHALEVISRQADLMVVSQSPEVDLNREWEEYGIHPYPSLIAGQELGTKAEHLAYGARGKYKREKILMIGDAPGDLTAAKHNEVAFYPIIPGRENESWVRFLNEGMDRFFTGTFRGPYEEGLIREFEAVLS